VITQTELLFRSRNACSENESRLEANAGNSCFFRLGALETGALAVWQPVCLGTNSMHHRHTTKTLQKA
jgi:hypothetical protein